MKISEWLGSHELGVLETTLALSGLGVFFGFIWNESSFRLVAFLPRLIEYKMDTKTLLAITQSVGAVSTILSGAIAAYLAYIVMNYFSITREKAVALYATLLWLGILYSYEIPMLEHNFVDSRRTTIIIFLTFARIAVDLLSGIIFWYILRRKLMRNT